MEQINFYPNIPIIEEDKNILLIALEKKMHILSYEKTKDKLFNNDNKVSWSSIRKEVELLPEQSAEIGSLIVAICKTMPDLREHEVIRQWRQELVHDPLASMRRKGEEVEVMLSPLTTKKTKYLALFLEKGEGIKSKSLLGLLIINAYS